MSMTDEKAFKTPQRKRQEINPHGLNVSHFRHELGKVVADLKYYKREELAAKLHSIADGVLAE